MCNHYAVSMANVKTIRLRDDLAAWLAAEAARARVSQNRIIEALLDTASETGWQFGKGYTFPRTRTTYEPLTGQLPEDVPQVRGLLSEDRR